MSASKINRISVLIQYIEVETRLTFVIVAWRILKDNRVFHDQDTLIG